MSTRIFTRILLFLTISIAFVNITVGQDAKDGVWTEINDTALSQRTVERTLVPSAYKTFRMNAAAMRSILADAPEEFSNASRLTQTILAIPMPDGKLARFKIEHSLIVEPGLLVKYPQLGATYTGRGIDDPTATVRLDFLPSGFHAMILSPNGTVMVDPYAKSDTENYLTYFKRDAPRMSNFACEFDSQTAFEAMFSAKGSIDDELIPDSAGPEVSSGTQLRTYRLALAATQEYTAAVGGGTVAGALAAQVLIMNRVDGVYERDLAIRMVVIANNDQIVYVAEPDPYTNTSGSTMLGQNQTTLDAVIGTANYDIGHVFSTGGGGVANLNVPCGASKARGVTGLSNPVGDAFSIDYVAHEMGHQWGANHTFNGTVSSCGGGNRSSGSAYEPGSGITIMAYAGICGNQNLDPHSIDTFHVKSLEVIVAFSQTGNGNTCAVTTATGNTPPTVSVVGGPAFNIPKQTPFVLTATGSDANGDSLTYDWEEYDLGGSTTAVPNTDGDGIARPIFRPYLQVSDPTRTFPSLQYILNNANVPPATTAGGLLTGELLPAIARVMTFQVVARDSRPNGGGINTATATVNIDANSGPFAVTFPNTPVTITVSDTSNGVTWNPANTTASPVSAANVRILASIDGGQTFPYVLTNSTPNDGNQQVFLPPVNTTTARIKIEGVNNIFFDVSDTNFTIQFVPFPSSGSRFDFDGDLKSDFSVYRNGIWYLQQSTAGFGAAQFGIATDRTVAADYDGDNKTDIAVFRDGVWYIINSGNGTIRIANWGLAGDIPVPGDYDGDAKADLAIYRSGVWYIYNSSNASSRIESFGLPSDKPVVGDFDGDDKQDLAVYRNGVWHVLGSTQGYFVVQFGLAGDIPQPADFDGDGKTDLAVYRNGIWYVLRSTAGFAALQFGLGSDIPATADFDGDGKSDFVVFRPSEGNWYLYQSTAGVGVFHFGLNGDKPIPAQSN
jgi:hypothetical protein